MSDRIFKDEAAKQRLENWYQKFLARAQAPLEHREITTSYGANHVLIAGNQDLPPLLCLHGSLASSAHIVPELAPLLEHFHIIAPDLPGQSVRGLPLRLPLKNDALGKWLLEIVDAMQLPQVDLCGVSWGGFVALQAAAIAPQKFRKLVLIVPAGVVAGSAWQGITQLAIPLARYKISPTDKNLRRFLEPLFGTPDENWTQYMGEAMRSFVLDMHPPPLAKAENFKNFALPTLVFGADQDISFPGAKLLARIKQLIPKAETELIANSKHSPPTTDEFRQWLAARITKFLA